MLSIDINCDMGESFGNYRLGNDLRIFPYISSCNIACGYHAGDPLHMEQTIDRALAHQVQIGAHPSYPDLAGFGRRKMHIPANELRALLKYQIAALKGMVESRGGRLCYVKPHGALYNSLADNPEEGQALIDAMQEIDPELILMGLAGSGIEQQAAEANIPFVAEAFADRRYEDSGHLRSRSLEGAVIHDPQEAAEQVIALIKHHHVISYPGKQIPIRAQSLCIHGDNPQAVNILVAIDEALRQAGILKRAFSL
ncbi:MAG: 5-oxoprolinase subunit PxpA [Bacteroidota bacterium]